MKIKKIISLVLPVIIYLIMGYAYTISIEWTNIAEISFGITGIPVFCALLLHSESMRPFKNKWLSFLVMGSMFTICVFAYRYFKEYWYSLLNPKSISWGFEELFCWLTVTAYFVTVIVVAVKNYVYKNINSTKRDIVVNILFAVIAFVVYVVLDIVIGLELNMSPVIGASIIFICLFDILLPVPVYLGAVIANKPLKEYKSSLVALGIYVLFVIACYAYDISNPKYTYIAYYSLGCVAFLISLFGGALIKRIDRIGERKEVAQTE